MQAQNLTEKQALEALLKKIPALAAYPAVSRRFARGQALTRFGEPLTDLAFMACGRAKVFRVMGNGRAVLYAMFEGVEVIGDLELMLGYPAATTDIVAITDGVLVTLPLASCKERILSDTALLRRLGEELAHKLERSSRTGAQNLLYPLSTRLAAYVLFSAQDGMFRENLTHLSEQMATSYRHLLRTLKAFCDEGWLQSTGQGYRILREEALAGACQEILQEAPQGP